MGTHPRGSAATAAARSPRRRTSARLEARRDALNRRRQRMRAGRSADLLRVNQTLPPDAVTSRGVAVSAGVGGAGTAGCALSWPGPGDPFDPFPLAGVGVAIGSAVVVGMAGAEVVGVGAVVGFGEREPSEEDPPLLTTRPTLVPLSAPPSWLPFTSSIPVTATMPRTKTSTLPAASVSQRRPAACGALYLARVRPPARGMARSTCVASGSAPLRHSSRTREWTVSRVRSRECS